MFDNRATANEADAGNQAFDDPGLRLGRIPCDAIIKQAGAVQGTATAAGLWATGAVGAAVGLGSYDVAIVVTLFTIFTFRILSPVKQQKTPGDDIGPPSGSS